VIHRYTRPKRIFAPITSNSDKIASPQAPTVGIVVCGQSNSEQKPSLTQSQVGQSQAAFATILAAAPRREGTLGRMRLSPIAKALRKKLTI
jgi:hypothetical protein